MMIAILFSFFAAASASLSNLFFHKNSHQTHNGSNASGYLIFYYLISLILSSLFSLSILNDGFHWGMLGIGACVGILNIGLMLTTFRALKEGPSGLTFAFQNTSAVFPGMILFLLFGEEQGFTYSYQQLVGILLVVYGLFLGAKSDSGTRPAMRFRWLKYAVACLAIQVIALTLIQARCVLFDCTDLSSSSLASRDDVSFLIGQFGAAFVVQTLYFLIQKNEWPRKEALYGSLGGVANFISMFMLLLATKWAQPFEKGILFPCFAVGTMIVCNIWANRLYGEKFNMGSNSTCALGILIGLIE